MQEPVFTRSPISRALVYSVMPGGWLRRAWRACVSSLMRCHYCPMHDTTRSRAILPAEHIATQHILLHMCASTSDWIKLIASYYGTHKHRVDFLRPLTRLVGRHSKRSQPWILKSGSGVSARLPDGYRMSPTCGWR